MRAVSIDMGDAATVAGLKTGQYVDVHFTPASIDDPVKGPFTMTLFKGVKVLALGAGAANSRGSNGVTLELTPEQANILILAKDKGALQLTYTPEGKGSGGVELEDADRATLAEILGLSKPKAEKPPFVTEIFSGSGRRTQLFQNGQRTDYYGVERYDYNRITPAVNGFGSSTGWNGDSFGGSGDDSGPIGGLNNSLPMQPAGSGGSDNGGSPAGGQNIGTPNGSFAAFGRSGTGEGL
jgi:pilus assembly protein CpaB